MTPYNTHPGSLDVRGTTGCKATSQIVVLNCTFCGAPIDPRTQSGLCALHEKDAIPFPEDFA